MSSLFSFCQCARSSPMLLSISSLTYRNSVRKRIKRETKRAVTGRRKTQRKRIEREGLESIKQSVKRAFAAFGLRTADLLCGHGRLLSRCGLPRLAYAKLFHAGRADLSTLRHGCAASDAEVGKNHFRLLFTVISTVIVHISQNGIFRLYRNGIILSRGFL